METENLQVGVAIMYVLVYTGFPKVMWKVPSMLDRLSSIKNRIERNFQTFKARPIKWGYSQIYSSLQLIILSNSFIQIVSFQSLLCNQTSEQLSKKLRGQFWLGVVMHAQEYEFPKLQFVLISCLQNFPGVQSSTPLSLIFIFIPPGEYVPKLPIQWFSDIFRGYGNGTLG